MAEQETQKENPVEKKAAEPVARPAQAEAKPVPKPAKPEPLEGKKEGKKVEAKAGKKEAVKTEAKEKKSAKEPVKKEPVKPKAKNEFPLSEEVLRRRKLIKQKISLPTFRGRFGIRSIRKKSKAKWNRWKKPRGIDIRRRQDDGAWPKTGYSAHGEIKDIHPSGFEEILVHNLGELAALNPQVQAARIAGTVGNKKRKEIKAKAKELKLKVLNR
jgi:large subunit ribosomal protein L32e